MATRLQNTLKSNQNHFSELCLLKDQRLLTKLHATTVKDTSFKEEGFKTLYLYTHLCLYQQHGRERNKLRDRNCNLRDRFICRFFLKKFLSRGEYINPSNIFFLPCIYLMHEVYSDERGLGTYLQRAYSQSTEKKKPCM